MGCTDIWGVYRCIWHIDILGDVPVAYRCMGDVQGVYRCIRECTDI